MRRTNSSDGTLKLSTASRTMFISFKIASKETACAVVRGKPSRMKPCLQSSLDKRSRTMPMVTLSGTSCPASIYFLASNPNGVDSFTAARNMSPVEI